VGRAAAGLPGGARAAGALALDGTAADGLDVLEAPGTAAGGIIEVRLEGAVLCGPTLGLALVGAGAVVPAVRLAAAVGGVLVLDVDVLDMPLPPSCLVGLLTGLLKPLRPDLAPGVGLAVSMIVLALLPGATSCFLTPFPPACILDGRGFPIPAAPLAAVGFGFACDCGCGSFGCSGGCSSTCLTPAARKNMP
jgi:hypothetical protein